MNVKKPFFIFFIVLYTGLIGKYIVARKMNELHKNEIRLKNLKEKLIIAEERFHQASYEFLSNK